jgi:phosphohistidine phosphatase
MNIHLIRHAKTNPLSESGKDFDRNLMAKGLQQCALLKEFSVDILENSRIYCSSSNRTRSTAKLILNDIQLEHVTYLDELYLASSKSLFDFLASLNCSEDVVIIGHNEGLSELVYYLTDENIILSTASLVSIAFDIPKLSWISKGTGVVKNHFSPKLL